MIDQPLRRVGGYLNLDGLAEADPTLEESE